MVRYRLNHGFYPAGTGTDHVVGDKVEKVQKRRGPKPDSKPAQNRRQELNRAAQR